MAPKAKNAGDLKNTGRKEPSAAVKMACGTCCSPNCHVLRRAMDTGSNVSSGEFVSMVCTWAECTVGGQMHKECYEKQEKVGARPAHPPNARLRHGCFRSRSPLSSHRLRCMPQELLAQLMRTTNTIGKGEMQKAIWTHKYDMVRPLCRCACTKGYFKPVAGEKRGSHVVDGEEGESPLDAAEVRKRELEVKLAKEAQRKKDQARAEVEARARRKEEATRRNAPQKTQKKGEEGTAAADGWQHVRGAAAVQPQQPQPMRRQPYAQQEQSWSYHDNGPSDFSPFSASGERPTSMPSPPLPSYLRPLPPPSTFELKTGDFPDMPDAAPGDGRPRLQTTTKPMGISFNLHDDGRHAQPFPRKRPVTSNLRDYNSILEIQHGAEFRYLVSGLIGKDGGHIKELQRLSGGAKVVVQQLKHIKADSRTRDIMISGTAEQRARRRRLGGATTCHLAGCPWDPRLRAWAAPRTPEERLRRSGRGDSMQRRRPSEAKPPHATPLDPPRTGGAARDCRAATHGKVPRAQLDPRG